jgi:hypothetical protein
MLKNIIQDLIGGSFTILGLAFAVIVLPPGGTQETMSALFLALTFAWLITGPLRWRE